MHVDILRTLLRNDPELIFIIMGNRNISVGEEHFQMLLDGLYVYGNVGFFNSMEQASKVKHVIHVFDWL